MPHHRWFWVDYDSRILCWARMKPAADKKVSSRAYHRSFFIDNIKEVRAGQQTEGCAKA